MEDQFDAQNLAPLIPELLRLCRAAGDIICEHYHSEQAADYQAKGDDSPLTEADLASDAVLQTALRSLTPDIPVLSEETASEVGQERLQWSRLWLIDPLDGTKEFLARTGEFTINIALIDQHKPIVGVLYAPLDRVAYVGAPGQFAQCHRYVGETGETVEPLRARALASGRPMTVLSSRRHRGRKLDACLDWIASNWAAVDRRNSGSALKFCQLAAGEGDLYPRFARCCEWDTAAGHAVLEAAGGSLVDMAGEPLRYNRRESLYSPSFYAIADPQHRLWRELLAANAGGAD